MVIRQGKVLADSRERIDMLRNELQRIYPAMNSRNVVGWSICFCLLEEVIFITTNSLSTYYLAAYSL